MNDKYVNGHVPKNDNIHLKGVVTDLLHFKDRENYYDKDDVKMTEMLHCKITAEDVEMKDVGHRFNSPK